MSAARDAPPVLIAAPASDAHTWNLIYLQLLVEELGHPTVNLGPCVPDETIVDACLLYRPRLLLLSSVNGHGHQDGMRLITRIRATADLAALPVVIGGKLGISGADPDHADDLRDAGFDAVFPDRPHAVTDFCRFIASLSERVVS
ncbi:cobalamin B12-binding domain-containing protein [Streptomyces sp. NPDC102283]|uniref:cobalamin B12-binding domain-containing protein n=1 Tax=Streptomyces sp. NPDC102283 TaxID=3366155 RepID=UPI00382A2144